MINLFLMILTLYWWLWHSTPFDCHIYGNNPPYYSC